MLTTLACHNKTLSVCSGNVNITSLCLFDRVSGQSRDVHLNGKSLVGVCEPSVWGCVSAPPCLCVCVCVYLGAVWLWVCVKNDLSVTAVDLHAPDTWTSPGPKNQATQGKKPAACGLIFYIVTCWKALDSSFRVECLKKKQQKETHASFTGLPQIKHAKSKAKHRAVHLMSHSCADSRKQRGTTIRWTRKHSASEELCQGQTIHPHVSTDHISLTKHTCWWCQHVALYHY